MKIAFIGDFMLSGDQAGKLVEVDSKLKKKLEKFDFRVATLETALGEYEDIDSVKSAKGEVAVWSKYGDLGKLKALDINAVSLANNHSCDCGVDSMLKMIEQLHANGVKTIGAGQNETEAMKPAVFEKDGESIAIVGCCKDDPYALGTLHFATSTQGGLYRLDEQAIVTQIKELKHLYNYVAVVVHWGVEHMWLPENNDVDIAKKMIDAGADMIIGGHPHHIQPMVTYKNRPIYYSLGNFYFPDFCLDKMSNTFYPKDEEFKKLPKFAWMYAATRNFPMCYFWKYYGRLGMISEINLSDEKVLARMFFSLYKNGRLRKSTSGLFHRVTLGLFSAFVGNKHTNGINHGIWKLRSVFENRVLSVFSKKYTFFKYLNSHNY